MRAPEEIWAVIENHPTYQISSWGRCVNSKGAFMTPHISGNSKQMLLCHGFSENGIQKQIPVKNLVAEAFIPNPEGKRFVILKNDIPYELNVDNIERVDKLYSMYRGIWKKEE